MRLLTTACVLMAAAVATASAQAPDTQTSWEPDIGGEIRVTGDSGQRTVGQFRSIDADTVRLLVADSEVAVDRSRILRMERRGDSLRNGFIIGAVVGILPAVLASGEIEAGGGNQAVAVMAGIGFYGLVGAGIDATRKGWTSVYEAKVPPTNTRRRQVWIAPTAHGMRAGYIRRF